MHIIFKTFNNLCIIKLIDYNFLEKTKNYIYKYLFLKILYKSYIFN